MNTQLLIFYTVLLLKLRLVFIYLISSTFHFINKLSYIETWSIATPMLTVNRLDFRQTQVCFSSTRLHKTSVHANQTIKALTSKRQELWCETPWISGCGLEFTGIYHPRSRPAHKTTLRGDVALRPYCAPSDLIWKVWRSLVPIQEEIWLLDEDQTSSVSGSRMCKEIITEHGSDL